MWWGRGILGIETTMANGFFIDMEKGVTFFRFEGVMTTQVGQDVFESYVTHPDFDPNYVMLTDARSMIDIDASFGGVLGGVRRLSQLLKAFQKGSKSIILVSNDASYGMARMLSSVLEMACNIQLEVTFSEDYAFEVASKLTGKPIGPWPALVGDDTDTNVLRPA